MAMYAFFRIVALGLDSFLACTVIGTRPLLWRERGQLVLAFGACDAMATLLGSLAPGGSIEVPAKILLVLCTFLVFAFRGLDRSWLYAVPLLLSFDNLFVGSPAYMAPILGLGSSLMALLGLCFGAVWRQAFYRFASEA